MASVQDRVIDIVASQLGVSKEQITPETSFINDLGADSLDTVELCLLSSLDTFELPLLY